MSGSFGMSIAYEYTVDYLRDFIKSKRKLLRSEFHIDMWVIEFCERAFISDLS